MSEDIVIPLLSRKSKAGEMVGRVQLLQDVASTAMLIPAAFARAHSASMLDLAFAILEFLGVAVLLIATVKELREKDDDIKEISWTNIIIGIVLIIENTLRTRDGHQHKIFSPMLVTAFTSIFIGVLQGRLIKRKRKRREIRISDTHIHIRLGKFIQFKREWSEITHIEDGTNSLRLTRTDGKTRKLSLKRFENAAEVRTAILDRAQRHAIVLTSASK